MPHSLYRLLFSFGCAFLLHAQVSKIPDASLEITVRQRDQGKIEKGLHILRLDCFKQRCSLTTVTLNQCVKNDFVPKIERTSTDEGTLRVKNVGSTLQVEEDLN